MYNIYESIEKLEHLEMEQWNKNFFKTTGVLLVFNTVYVPHLFIKGFLKDRAKSMPIFRFILYFWNEDHSFLNLVGGLPVANKPRSNMYRLA